MKLLHLDSSILGDNSASRAIGAAVVERLRRSDAGLDVVHRDLVTTPLPHLTRDVHANLQGNADLEEFLAADIVVIGAPLYNFTIPSQLKAWIDRILVAGQTFRYTENGPEGLAGAKRVIVAMARGSVYGEGSPYAAFEHAEKLLRIVLAFIGVREPEFVIAEGLAQGESSRQVALAAALVEAGQLAPTRLEAALA